MHARIASPTATAEMLAEAEVGSGALECTRALVDPKCFLEPGFRCRVRVDDERAAADRRSKRPRDAGRARLAFERRSHRFALISPAQPRVCLDQVRMDS